MDGDVIDGLIHRAFGLPDGRRFESCAATPCPFSHLAPCWGRVEAATFDGNALALRRCPSRGRSTRMALSDPAYRGTSPPCAHGPGRDVVLTKSPAQCWRKRRYLSGPDRYCLGSRARPTVEAVGQEGSPAFGCRRSPASAARCRQSRQRRAVQAARSAACGSLRVRGRRRVERRTPAPFLSARCGPIRGRYAALSRSCRSSP